MEAGEVLVDATAEDGGVQGAPVDAGRQAERVDLDGVLQGDWMKTSKTTLLNLRRLEQDNSFWQKTTSKTSRKEMQKYVPFSSFVGIMSEMVLTRKGE